MMQQGKKIVLLTGSPRQKGNSAALATAFEAAAQKKGHTVTRFDTARLKVAGCLACDSCYKKGPCIVEDDFNTLAPAIEEADAVVFAAPLYWYTFPAQLKAVFDKFYAFSVAGRPIAGKQCALLATCEEDDPAAFEGMRLPYTKSVQLMGWQPVGEVLVTGVNAAGDVHGTDGEARAAALAELF